MKNYTNEIKEVKSINNTQILSLFTTNSGIFEGYYYNEKLLSQNDS